MVGWGDRAACMCSAQTLAHPHIYLFTLPNLILLQGLNIMIRGKFRWCMLCAMDMALGDTWKSVPEGMP